VGTVHSRKIVCPSKRLAFAKPARGKAWKIAISNLAVEARKLVSDVHGRVELFERKPQLVSVVEARVRIFGHVYNLRQVVVRENEFVGHRGRDHVDDVARPAGTGLLPVLWEYRKGVEGKNARRLVFAL
jgi:hypothetical protein